MEHLKKFENYINEDLVGLKKSKNAILEDKDWMEVAQSVLFGPIYAAYKKNPEEVKKIAGELLGGLLATETGKSAFKNIINLTPAGLIKNMSIAAANGDADSFKTAWKAANKYASDDLKKLEKAAFNDMKQFGLVLKKIGVG